MKRATAAGALSLTAVLLFQLAAPSPAHADEWRDKEYWLTDYGITEAWKKTQGEGVKVAVIDTGIDPSHPDLAGAVSGGTDVSGAGDPRGARGLGVNPEHGTLVATLLAGRGHTDSGSGDSEDSADSGDSADAKDSGDKDKEKYDGPGNGPDGIIGVAPKAELLSVSAWIGGSNPGGVPIDDQLPNAVRWAVDSGAKVINMSLGSSSTAWPESWDDAFLYAEQNDVVIVAAAGNRGVGMIQVGAPATIPGVLTVAGLDRQGKASWDSSSEGISIGVAAPAENLVGGLPNGPARYAEWSGTSAAAPLVSGVAALIRSAHPELSAAQVINRIITTAKDGGAPGRDTLYGYGIVDANAAVNANVPAVAANPLGTIEEWIRIHRRGEAPAAPESEPPAGPAVPDIPEPQVPVAAEPYLEEDPVPAALVLGFGGLILLVGTAGTIAVLRVRRSGRAVPEPGTEGPPEGGEREKAPAELV
ncbi:S8 family serine peptidase [Arthrobacter sp. Sa2CUA1]|uniref:S8 family serine peptidase n=1 Tax=Arthrobacter gallicola TaxID=2762225 RepID=A0ABR8UVY6_9MICC|nr:S8 family serine peptidase [Arthrobacter gallicola]MBD7996689.1 S8 family serine peptidase [Arthrobacter gallicola]